MSSGGGMDQLGKAVNDLNLGSAEDGSWHSVSKKTKNKAVKAPPKQRPLPQAPLPKAWGQADTAKRLGMSNNTSGNAFNNTSHGMRPYQGAPATASAGRGRNWTPSSGSSQASLAVEVDDEGEKISDDNEASLSDDDDEDLFSDGYDSDESPCHESKKQHRMLKAFFDVVDKLTVDEVSDSARQWHCPACQGGPGAIDWYKGLQPLVTHARTKGSIRVKLHRMFADLLDEELRRKGTSVVSAGEAFGKWEGLLKDDDRQIVWPPMVMVMNTILDQDDNNKWLGMGNQELVDYFKEYEAVRAKHSYGPRGHRGISVLIFDGTAMGYIEAERLHKHFLVQGTGRTAWENPRKVLFYAGGKRQLYGFLAKQDDIEDFNKHCPGKTRLKYDMRSYKEKFVDQLKQMNEDNQQLIWYKSERNKEKGRNKVLVESFTVLSKMVRKTNEENRIVRERTTAKHEEDKQEMDYQEGFFNEQIQKIQDETNAKEDRFEKLQQDERRKVEEPKTGSSKDLRLRAEEVTKFIEFQEQEMEKFEREREELIRANEKKKVEMKKKHWEEEIQLEKDFDTELTELMQKYAPAPIEGDTAAGNLA